MAYRSGWMKRSRGARMTWATDRLWIRYAQQDQRSRDANGSIPAGYEWWLSPSLTIVPTSPRVGDQAEITVVVDATQQVSNIGVQVWASRWGPVPSNYPASGGGNGGFRRTGLTTVNQSG